MPELTLEKVPPMSAPEPRDGRWLALLPLAAALVALTVTTLWPLNPASPELAAPQLFPVLVLLAALAGVHAPLGARSMGLGTLVLPAVVFYFGTPWAGWFGAAAFLLARLIGLAVPRSSQPRSLWTIALAADLGRVVLGCLAAAAGWSLADGGDLLPGAVAASSYLGVLAVLSLAEAGSKEVRSPRWPTYLCLDLVGWILGLAIFRVIGSLGWGVAAVLLGGVVLLSLEAMRWARGAAIAESRAQELREVALAGHRIIFRNPDLLAIAEQIQIECRRMFSFFWFEFELLNPPESRSWHAGPDGRVRSGAPEVPANPPTVPGFHRRSGWRIIERELATHDRIVARLRFWCHRRQLAATSLELFDTLLPQMASSIQRALLDREARHDPLTDLPDRRALESHLERVYDDCLEEGQSMAVILCDLDRFKRINDKYGHKVGDLALIEVARLLEIHRRDADLCCRYGGEEFALVLERTDGRTALSVAERLRSAVELNIFVNGRDKIPLKLSAGLAAFPELHVKTPGELLELADEALYEAKRQGRNRCLLNLGRGEYMDRYGDVLSDGKKAELEPPSLFA